MVCMLGGGVMGGVPGPVQGLQVGEWRLQMATP